MRLTVNENTILKAIGESHPVKSSFAKLVKESGMARNEIEDTVDGLKKVGYLNVTAVNEIYLLDDGRKYLGINSLSVKAKSPGNSTDEIIAASEHHNISSDKEPTPFVGSVSSVAINDPLDAKQHPILTAIDDLESKLNKPANVITDLDLKGQALTKLAALLSEDIAELLLDVKADLERAAA